MADAGLSESREASFLVRAARSWWGRTLVVFAASRVVTTAILLAFAAIQDRNAWTGPQPDYVAFANIWDGLWYYIVAASGYPTELPLDNAGHVAENSWAFLPGYPMLVGALWRGLGVPYPVMAVVVSVLCAAGATLLFNRLMARVLPAGTALFATVLFCVAPTSPVLQVAYAEPLQLLLLFWALLLLLDRRYLALIPVVALLAVTRPGALAFALLLVAHGVLRWLRRRADPVPPRELVAVAVAAVASGLLGIVWPVVAWVATGDPSAYTDTELAWRAPYIGRQELVPFTAWFQGAHWWLAFVGLPDAAAWALGVVLVLALVALLVAGLLSRPARALGPDLRLWIAAYALYLLAVFFPQSSTFRILMPFAPALGALAVPRSPVWRATLVGLGIAGQIGWVAVCWWVNGSDWTPP